MTKTKAIEILNKQIVKLEKDQVDKNQWNLQTNTYLRSFFGEDSEQSVYLNYHTWNYNQLEGSGQIKDKKQPVIDFIGDCIDTIQDLGLKKLDPKGNFLTRISDKWAVTVVSSLVVVAFFLGRLAYRVFDCVPCT